MAKYSVSYVYEIVDKYSKTIDKISRKTGDFARKAAEATTKASLSFQKFGKTLQSVGTKMLVGVTLPIALMARSMINATSDAEETRSKYATVFKEIGTQAETTADKFAKSFGLAGTTSRKLLGDTGDMLSGFGFTSEAALKLSERTNSLAVDLASFTNFSGGAEGASAALTKALLGERESVKSLGIAILESDVKKKIAQMRSEGIKFATEREAKAYATLEIAISQSKNAIGDYERTKNSFANTQRRVAQNNIELEESFGRLLIPSATKALNVIDRLQAKFIAMDESTKKVILVIAGLVAIIAPLLLALAAIGFIAPAVTAGFWLLVAAITFILSPIGLVIAAVSVLIGAFAKLMIEADGIGQGLKAVFLGIGLFITKVFTDLGALILDVLLAPLKLFFRLIDKLPMVKVPEGLKDFGYFSGQSDKLNNMLDGKAQGLMNPAAQGAAGKNGADGVVTVKAEKGTSITNILGDGVEGAIGSNFAGER